MAGMMESTKRRAVITLVMVLAALAFVAGAVFCLMPVRLIADLYKQFGGELSPPDAFKWPLFIYILRVAAVIQLWLAATFVLILTNPVKYRLLYWLNMLALLVCSIMCFVAGIHVGMPLAVFLIDGVLGLIAAVLLFLVRPRPSV